MKACYQFIESLEPRIAPAILVNGGNLLGGKGNPTTGQTSNGGNTVTLVKVLQGEALVFFEAGSHGIITGISVGKHTKLDITGDVTGDIVTNLLPNGQLTDSDHNPANGQDGGVLLPTTFLGVTTHPLGNEHGSIGRIIAGGSVQNVNVAGNLSGIYAGDGIFKTTTNREVDVYTGGVDFNTIAPGLNDLIKLHAGDAQSSAVSNISNVTVGLASHLQVFAGDGKGAVKGGGNAGGGISNITVTATESSDLSTPALYLHAGNGAKGPNGGAGGVGGSISHYTDAASNSFIKLQTGNGGPGATGGAGGSFTNSSISSNALVYDVLVGHGGSGATGGGGGSINTITFNDAVTGQAPLIATGDFTGDGIPDVLLVNTVTGNATLSAGLASTTSKTQAPFQVLFHPSISATGAANSTSFIAPEGRVASALVAADLNGDGKLDFAVSYSASDNLGIFINQGNGNFTASAVALPASPTRIAVGDYLNTGHLDIAVLTAGTVANGGPTLASQIYVAEGNGTGTFGTLSTPDIFPGIATDLVSGQLDGTGGVDLVVGFRSGFVDTFLANGSATAAPFTLGSSASVFASSINNLDLSGNLLLAFTANFNANPVTGSTVAPTPHVQLLNVAPTGDLSELIDFVPGDVSPSAAHFLGSPNAIGVVSPSGITIYTPAQSQNTYLSLTSIASTGALSNFVSTVLPDGTFQIDAVGASSSRFLETSGSISNLNTLKPFDIPGQPYITTIQAGAGGAGVAHNGGAGGSINDLTFTQSFGPGVEQAGARFNLTIASGNGGTSKGGAGGGGGALQQIALSLNPADSTGNQDSTTLAALSTGSGGAGASGGRGGDMSNIMSNSIFDQPTTNGTSGVIVNSVALQLVTGNGGNGTHGAGGNGGAITLPAKPALDGVSSYDIVSTTPFATGLLVQSGNGGNGTTTGGNGGNLVNIATENSLAGSAAVSVNELGSASIVSGSGGRGGAGAGGAGGAITGLNVSVQSQSYLVDQSKYLLNNGGSLVVTSGSGGLSRNGIGGSAGSITKATVGSVDGDGFYRTDNFSAIGVPQFPGFTGVDPLNGVGVVVHGGAGANGAKGGGAGGGIDHLRISSPSAPDVYAGVLLGGNGGNATHSGSGGDGGSITSVLQRQDVNSSLSVVQGGDAGTGVGGRGGSGGSVSNVNTAGFIGLPATNTADLGAFNDTVAAPVIASLFVSSNIPQGVFAGRGAVGGVAGSVIDVVARQITAIGGSVNAAGHFGVAHAVTHVTADLIGNEVVRDNHFSSTVPGHVSPAKAKPVDGFILAASVSGLVTQNNGRTAKFTFKG